MILPSYLSLIIFNTWKHGDRLEKTVQAVQIKKRVALPLTLPLNTIKLAWCVTVYSGLGLEAGEGFPSGSDGKESACNSGNLGSIPE